MMNEIQIESIKEKSLKSRITHEYNELSRIYTSDNITVLYNTQQKQNTITITITINRFVNEMMETHTFVVDKKNPFVPPIYHYNDRCYSHYLNLPSQKFQNILKSIYNKDCLCCSSLNCKYNWSPAIKLNMFINELNKIRQYKRNIVYKLLCDRIKQKYLNDDIPIENFLFYL
jgi:hypothetical protein